MAHPEVLKGDTLYVTEAFAVDIACCPTILTSHVRWRWSKTHIVTTKSFRVLTQ